MRDQDVVVVDPADDPRAVDVAEGSRYLAQAHGNDCHIFATSADGHGWGHGTGLGWRGAGPRVLQAAGWQRDGQRLRLLFRTRLPYTLGFDVQVTRVQPPSRLEARLPVSWMASL
jgi:hypothetical protein